MTEVHDSFRGRDTVQFRYFSTTKRYIILSPVLNFHSSVTEKLSSNLAANSFHRDSTGYLPRSPPHLHFARMQHKFASTSGFNLVLEKSSPPVAYHQRCSIVIITCNEQATNFPVNEDTLLRPPIQPGMVCSFPIKFVI